MGVQANPYPLRINKVLMDKFKYVASQNNRSVNKEIEYIIKQVVLSYEQEHGEIKVEHSS